MFQTAADSSARRLSESSEDEECSSPPSARAELWETVLKRSLLTEDPERLHAAIEMAESMGASRGGLANARGELTRLADAALLSATYSGGDATSLLSAVEKAEELGASREAISGAQEELQRLVTVALKAAVASGEKRDLEDALELASTAGSLDFGLEAEARSQLRKASRAQAREIAPSSSPGSLDVTSRSLPEVTAPEAPLTVDIAPAEYQTADEPPKPLRRIANGKAAAGLGPISVPQTNSIVAPSVIGRPASVDTPTALKQMAVEGGWLLSEAQTLHNGNAARKSNASEPEACTIQ